MAINQIKLSTTGTISLVVLNDLGARSFSHPTVNFNLLTEYSLDTLLMSEDLKNAIDNGYITLKNENDVAIKKVDNVPFYNVKNNLIATTDPTTSNDKLEGYSFSSNWINTNTNETFLCLDNSIGTAIWITPVTFSIDKSFCFDAGRNANTTNLYLRSGNGTPTNITPFILPFDSTIIAISAATNGNETWTAEIHKNNTLITGAFLSITSASSAYNNTYNINVNQGDGLQIYCNGENIKRPRIIVWLKRR